LYRNSFAKLYFNDIPKEDMFLFLKGGGLVFTAEFHGKND
jgi:hypothetical protein